MKRVKQILKNGGLFLLLAALTIWIIGRETDPRKLLAAAAAADPPRLLGAFALAAVFLCCEGCNLARLLGAAGCECTGFRHGLHYACTGFFFSAVTPSASGGQPMQLYRMYKDGVPLAKGTLALVGEFLSFQVVSTAMAAAGFWLQRPFLAEQLGRGRFFLLAGMGLNLAVAAVLLLLILRPGAVRRLAALAVKLIALFSRKRGGQAEAFLDTQLAAYGAGAAQLRQSPALILKTLATTLLQLTAMYGVTYLVYRAMGFDQWDFLQVTALQAVLSVSVSILPLPGAVGVSEGVFLLLFQSVLPGGGVEALLLLSRTAAFYLPVAVTGALTVLFGVLPGRNRSCCHNYLAPSGKESVRRVEKAAAVCYIINNEEIHDYGERENY